MKRSRTFNLLIFIVLNFIILAGCGQNESSPKISNQELREKYITSIDNAANVMDGYAKSVKTETDYVSDPANKQIKWINSTKNKLTNNDSNDNNKYFVNYLDELKKETLEYKNDNFDNSKKIDKSFAKDTSILKKKISVNESNKKLKQAKSHVNDSQQHIISALNSQPHVDGKSVNNSIGEITFNSVKSVPGDDNEKIVEINYTYKNSSSDDVAPYKALIYSGDFTQESDDSVNSLAPGAPASEWEQSNSEIMNMWNDSTQSKLKSGMTKQYITFVKVENNNDITFNAKNPGSNESIGKIKLSID